MILWPLSSSRLPQNVTKLLRFDETQSFRLGFILIYDLRILVLYQLFSDVIKKRPQERLLTTYKTGEASRQFILRLTFRFKAFLRIMKVDELSCAMKHIK